MASADSIPDGFILDVHDLSAIILDAHIQTNPMFSNAHLVEVNHGNTPLVTLPQTIFPSQWSPDLRAEGQTRVAYILKKDPHTTERVSIDTFAASHGVKTPEGHELTHRDLESIFWRCKTYNDGYVLSYVAKRVFDSLPPTAKLRARTSSKHVVLCKPSDVTVAEIEIVPKEACLIVEYEPRPDLGSGKVDITRHLSGFQEQGIGMPWVFLLIGEPKSEIMNEDPRVALDLVTPQIGGRGRAGEVFSLERAFEYHEKVLSKVSWELPPYALSGDLRLAEDTLRARGDTLLKMVLDRVRKIASGQDNFCQYCGKDGVDTRCSKCKKAYFCSPCHMPGWKYHKVWCS